MADAGAVDFDADVARLRRGSGHLYEAVAVAEADFEVEVARVTKERGGIQPQRTVHFQSVTRPMVGEGAFLSGGDASLAQDVAADGARLRRFSRVCHVR